MWNDDVCAFERTKYVEKTKKGGAAFGRPPFVESFVDGSGKCSSIKQQAPSKHQASSSKHQAASIKKLGSETLARN